MIKTQNTTSGLHFETHGQSMAEDLFFGPHSGLVSSQEAWRSLIEELPQRPFFGALSSASYPLLYSMKPISSSIGGRFADIINIIDGALQIDGPTDSMLEVLSDPQIVPTVWRARVAAIKSRQDESFVMPDHNSDAD